MKMEFSTHTIVMLVGPTECGKTTFAREVLLPQLMYREESKNFNMNVQHISSDDIRRDILGEDLDKHAGVMMESSKLAFDLFFKKLDVLTTYPVNAEVVVLDTTGLSDIYRKEVAKFARDNNYKLDVVVFDYKENGDYYCTDKSKRLVGNHVKRLKREVLKELRGKDYNKVYRVRHKDFIKEDGKGNFEKYKVSLSNLEDYVGNFLEEDKEYVVIGDVHEHLEGLKDLLGKIGFIIKDGKIKGHNRVDNKKVVLVGDWIDKGESVQDIVEFLYDNKGYFEFVLGNHENFVMKYLRGEIKGNNEEVISSYFTSISYLEKENNKDVLDKANVLFDLAKPFVIYRGMGRKSFIVTHAPCENKYLGKMDNRSVREQRVIRFEKGEDVEKRLDFLNREAEFNQPYHIFGHVPNKEGITIYNKLGIDTGAVNGNKLTSVEIAYRPFYNSVNTKHVGNNEEKVPVLFRKKEKIVRLKDLDKREARSVYGKAMDKVNFISGTMTPSDKDEENGVLESLEKGLEYFKDKGIDKVILQPKYMGSRGNIYLNIDVEKSYAVSRGGFIVRRVDLTEVFKDLLGKYKGYMTDNNLEWMVFDGEILPWRAMGGGLIDDSFSSIVEAVEIETELLDKYGFDEEVTKVIEDRERSGFVYDTNELNKNQLRKKYGNRLYQNFSGLEGYNHIDVEDHKEMIEVFKEQVELFGVEGDVHYKAFAVLKMIDLDGDNVYFEGNNEEMFNFVSDDEYLIVDLNCEEGIELADSFFRDLTENKKMEGVVIKPVEEREGVLPFMKVRNERYLTIVYGYDYKTPHKYKKLINQKRINAKVRASLKEYELGKKMLDIPLKDVDKSNKEYLSLVANMLMEVKREERIDPRL